MISQCSILSISSITIDDCTKVSVDDSVNQLGQNVTVTLTAPTLQPVYPGANNMTLHIWIPDNVNLSVTDTELERVDMWKSPSCGSDEPGRFQTARIMATSTFVSGANNFTANVLPLIANRVSCSIIPCTHKFKSEYEYFLAYRL